MSLLCCTQRKIFGIILFSHNLFYLIASGHFWYCSLILVGFTVSVGGFKGTMLSRTTITYFLWSLRKDSDWNMVWKDNLPYFWKTESRNDKHYTLMKHFCDVLFSGYSDLLLSAYIFQSDCVFLSHSLKVNRALLEWLYKGLKYCQSFEVLTGAINKTNLFQNL